MKRSALACLAALAVLLAGCRRAEPAATAKPEPPSATGSRPREVAAAKAPALAAEPRQVEYNRDVRPLLAERCFRCHGVDEAARKANLRLDLREGALVGGKSGKAALLPGQPEAGELWARLTSTDPERRMPPAEAGKPLDDGQLAVLRTWIAQGAVYEPHWAFVPPRRPPAPSVRLTGWPKSDPDRFILARLEREGLAPSAPAARPALLRRLSLDLTGLPPTLEELDAFERDPTPGAWSRQISRLLNSAHFGERWARWWMDAARYADSDGYEKDLPREQSAWRDWVINAFNQDMGYDQFLIRQLAGDLLAKATQDDRVATGFLRNGMVNEEAAIVAEQFRMEGLFDRMDCLGKSILGLTIQCGQCHSHKYDPFSQEEYYRMFAYLNDDYEAVSPVYSAEEAAQIRQIQAGVAEWEARARARRPGWREELAAWEAGLLARETAWVPLHPAEAVTSDLRAHPEVLPDGSVLTLGFRPTECDLITTAGCTVANATGLRLEALAHGDLPLGGPGRSRWGGFAVSELMVEAALAGASNGWSKIPLTGATADFAQPEQRIPAYFRPDDTDKRTIGPAAFLIDGRDDTAWGSYRGPAQRRQGNEAVVQFAAGAPPLPEGARLRVTLRFRHGGTNLHGPYNQHLGRFRLSVTTAPAPHAAPVAPAVRAALRTPPEKRSAEESGWVFSAWRAAQPDLQDCSDAIAALEARFPEGRSVLNLAMRDPAFHRETHLLERGDWLKPGRVLAPGVPAFLNPLPEGAPANRLGLALWMTDRRAPTTARVLVNRVWQAVFGVGIVETAEDFGVRGAEPSHPELLDWLAVEFMDHGWSLKHLLRTIAESASYQQDSRIPPGVYERDPQNRLLGRGPRLRAEAEAVRDIALTAAGLLDERVGGPSFYPAVPENFFRLSFVIPDFWRTAAPPERYRRSVYSFRRRTIPDPMLSSFDAPSGEAACVRRNRSNTPLAALAGLNEAVLVEAARTLALRICLEGGPTEETRLVYGFRRCTSRLPRASEQTALLNLLHHALQHTAQGWVAARDVAFGQSEVMPPLPPTLAPLDLAGWTVVSRVLLNLDETITKN